MKSFRGMLLDCEGQGLVEYAMILALVAMVIVGTLKVLGAKPGPQFNKAGNALT